MLFDIFCVRRQYTTAEGICIEFHINQQQLHRDKQAESTLFFCLLLSSQLHGGLELLPIIDSNHLSLCTLFGLHVGPFLKQQLMQRYASMLESVSQTLQAAQNSNGLFTLAVSVTRPTQKDLNHMAHSKQERAVTWHQGRINTAMVNQVGAPSEWSQICCSDLLLICTAVMLLKITLPTKALP